MAEEKKDYWREFARTRDNVASMSEIRDRAVNDPVPDIRAKNLEAHLENIASLSKRYGEMLDLSKAKPEEREKFYETAVNDIILESNSAIYKNLDEFVSQIDTNTLERMVLIRDREGDPIISPPSGKKELEIYTRYYEVQAAKKIKRNHEDGKLDKEGEKIVMGMAARGYAEQEIERIRKEHKNKEVTMSKEWYDERKNLIMASVLGGYMDEGKYRENATRFLGKYIETAEKEYMESAEKSGSDIYKIMRKGIRELARNGGVDFERVASGLYAAYKASAEENENKK